MGGHGQILYPFREFIVECESYYKKHAIGVAEGGARITSLQGR